MKYIGITGHRGSGKTSIAYLLGNLLENLRLNLSKEQCQTQYNRCCKLIQENNHIIYDCGHNYVYFDEFGETPKYMVATLLGIDMSVLDNDILKDTMYVNLKDFKLYTYNESFKVITTTDIIENSSKRWKDAYISLGEFARCFSVDIMQRYLGNNVWVKMINLSKEKFGELEDGWRIYADVKFDFEVQYIKDNNGFMIGTKRPSNKKKNTRISNTIEASMDYTINTEGELESLFEPIYSIAKDIYEKTKR
jgi:hypothetical protein